MSAAIAQFLLGALFGAIVLLAAQCLLSKKSDPGSDIERRGTRGCRRKRFATAAKIDQIGAYYRAGALTYPQAVQRLRDQETHADIAPRVLGQQLNRSRKSCLT